MRYSILLNNNRYFACLAILAFIGVVPAWGDDTPATAPAPVIDIKALGQLSPDDRFAVLLAILQWHQTKLQDFSCSLGDDFYGVDLKTKTRVLVEHTATNVAHSAETMWSHVQRRDADEKTEVESWSSWDGKEGRILTTFAGDSPQHRGVVSDGESNTVRTSGYLLVLGLRVNLSMKNPVTLAEWLESIKKKSGREKIEISTDKVRERDCILLKITLAGNERSLTYWIDPSHDFLIAKYEDKVTGKEGMITQATIEVKDSKKVGDITIPFEVIRSTQTSLAPTAGGEEVYKVTSFSTDRPKREALVIDFPAGCRLLNAIEHRAYLVTPEKKLQELPVFNSDTTPHPSSSSPPPSVPAK